jgi:hypothetical protein
MPGASLIQITGNISIRSCCGYSTDDIEFSISTTHYPSGRNFGVVSGSFSFEWNVTKDNEYELSFDNRWLTCTPTICQPDPSSPSYHNKTITLNISEVGELESPGLPFALSELTVELVSGLLILSTIASIAVILFLKRKRRPSDKTRP